MLICLIKMLVDVFHQRPFESATQYLFFVIHKHFHTRTNQCSNHISTIISHNFIFICKLFLFYALQYLCFSLWRKERKQEILGFVERQDLEFMTVFDVHHLVTNIVGSLNKIHKWVTSIAQF